MLEISRQSAADILTGQDPVIALEGEWIAAGTLQDIPIDQIVVSPYQPRLVFDVKALEDLATSIQTIGQGKPVLVRPLPDGRFELVGGERRWRAIKLIGWQKIQAIIKPMTDGVAMVLALTDNEQEDLSDYELAKTAIFKVVVA